MCLKCAPGIIIAMAIAMLEQHQQVDQYFILKLEFIIPNKHRPMLQNYYRTSSFYSEFVARLSSEDLIDKKFYYTDYVH